MTKKFADIVYKHKKLSALILGLLSVAALPPFYQFYTLFISFSGLFLLVNKSTKSSEAFACGYWFGFGFFALGFSWIGNALLIDNSTRWIYPLALLGSGVFFGLFTAFPTYLANKLKNTYCKYFAFCSILVIFEWVRSFIFTGFPWNQFGSVLAFDLRLVQTASIWGTYGLSFIVLILCTSPSLVIYERTKKSVITSLVLILSIISFTFFYGHIRINANKSTENSDIKIRMVQPAIPQEFKWDESTLLNNLIAYTNLSKAEGFEDIDIVIWGETASPFPLDMEPIYIEYVKQAVPENGYLITGSIRYEFNKDDQKYEPANSLFVINSKGEITDKYDKHHLVPFGEYIPLRKYLPKWIKPITKQVANFKQGEGNRTIALGDYPSFGPLICYEIIFPSQVINSFDPPKWLINITNDGWYGNSMGPYQHLVTTQLRAVEEGLTIARVANTGISALISYTGGIIASIPLNKSGNLDSYLPKKLYLKTFYGKYGNFIILILIITNIIIMFIFKNNKESF